MDTTKEMIGLKEFKTAAKKAAEQTDEEAIEFKVDGVVLHAYPPSEGQFAMLMSAMTDYATAGEQMSASINFVWALLDEESGRYIKRRLMDRADDFGGPEILEIIEFLVEEITGNPTQGPSASTSSPAPAGKRSTAKRQHATKTSSRSPQPASAT